MAVEGVVLPWRSLETPAVVGGGAPLLRIEGLSRAFGDRAALSDLSLEIGRGEMFGLLGPNGAGKSTAFAILAGLLRADAGTLHWGGEERGVSDVRFRAELGLIFQRSTLDDLLSARENLLLSARLYGLATTLARSRTEEMLELIELRDRGDERVSTWSGGMRRRLELARALLHRPRLLLMDEPTQGLDEAAFRRFWAHLGQLRSQEGVTAFLTTHRAEEAQACDRLAVLDAGRTVAIDTPAALIAQVGGDVVFFEALEPEALVVELRTRLGIDAHVTDGGVRIEQRDGHTLIPRVVEALPPGRISAVHLRRPSLADVFLRLTGKSLAREKT